MIGAAMARRRSEQMPANPGGSVAIKRCRTCQREVLSAYRGEVTAVGQGQILSVARDGSVIGQCCCGGRVVWEREIQRPR